MTFGGAMKIHRRRHGLTQTDLSKRLNISRISIARYETDATVPSVDTARRIADSLKFSLHTYDPVDMEQYKHVVMLPCQ